MKHTFFLLLLFTFHNLSQASLTDLPIEIRLKIYSHMDNDTFLRYYTSIQSLSRPPINEDVVQLQSEMEDLKDRVLNYELDSDYLAPIGEAPISALTIKGQKTNWRKENIERLLGSLPDLKMVTIKFDCPLQTQKEELLTLNIVPIKGIEYKNLVTYTLKFLFQVDLITLTSLLRDLAPQKSEEKLRTLYQLGYIYPESIIKIRPRELFDQIMEKSIEEREKFCTEKKEEFQSIHTGRKAQEIFRVGFGGNFR